MGRRTFFLFLACALVQPALADTTPRPDQIAYRDLYKELIETDTSYPAGDCTLAAQRMAARLKAAGYPDRDLNVFVPDDHPREGGLVAILHGRDPKVKGILLLAHIDVVQAKPSEWKRDPFKLVEENGYFYARGATDDKAMASVWVDSLIRYHQEGFHPRRDIKMALTCGEETSQALKGAYWLSTEHKDWVDAAFGLNEGVGGNLDEKGNRISLGIESGEKTYQDYTLATEDAGGHASRPSGENAIARLSAGLVKLQNYEFPVQFNDTTTTFFNRTADLHPGEVGNAMRTLIANPNDASALAVVARDPAWHSMLHTTCVITTITGGEARNASPQHVQANVNCRIFPGVSKEAVMSAIAKAVDDPKIAVTAVESAHPAPVTPPPPLTPAILKPVDQVAAKLWPGVPVIPTLSTGATDARYMTGIGIPTYGISGMFGDPDGDGVHGLNERIRVRSLYEGRDFLYALVKLYADAP